MLTKLRGFGLLRIASVYVVAGWILIQFADISLQAFEVPALVMQLIMLLVLLGFPITVTALWMLGVRLNQVAIDDQEINPAALPGRDNRPSITLLPFRCIGDEQSFLAEGLRIGLQTNMVRLSGLFQIYTYMNEAYLNGEISGEARAGAVNAQYVLEATIAKLTDQIRVSMQLTEVATGRCAWAEQYDREQDDLFGLQDEIIREVISSLNIELSNPGIEKTWFQQLQSAEAKEWYFRGTNHFAGQTYESNSAARDAYERLYELQPDSAIGPSNMALTHWNDFIAGWSPDPAISLSEAIRWADIARSYEHNDGFGDAVYAYQQLHERNYGNALQAARRSVRTRPNCPLSLGILGQIENYCGEPETASVLVEKALSKVEIAFPWMANVLATIQRDSDRYSESLETVDGTLEAAPDLVEALVIKCSDYSLLSKRKEARSVADRIKVLDPDWSCSTYMANEPYRDRDTLDRVVQGLEKAGLS